MEHMLYCYLGKHKWEGRNRPLKKAVVAKFATTSVRYYADFAYYFDLAVHFLVLRHHPKLFPLNPLPKKYKEYSHTAPNVQKNARFGWVYPFL